MKTLFAVASVSTLIGCSSVAAHSNVRTASDEATRGAELTALRVQFEEQEQELRTVRGQLALARAEVQELKGDKSLSSGRSKRSASDLGLPWATNGGDELAMDPVLRIDGEIALAPRAAPKHGADTDHVLRHVLGYDETRIAELQESQALESKR